MAAEKKITSRIQQKHDTAANWANATTFIPKKGEIVIYDAEYNTSGVQTQAVRFKIGDGSRTINNLPFALIDYDNRITSLENTVEGLGTAAQKDVGFFATAAQGTKADNAVPNTRKVNNKALSTDIKLEPSDVGVTESAFPGLKKTGTITGIKMNGASKGTSGVVDLGTVLTNASAFATAAQGTKADNAMPKSGGTFTGEVKFGSTENFQGYYIKRMIGSLGAGTSYANLSSSYKDGTWHRMWRLRFPSGSSFWGKIKITLYGGYSSFNASGVMSKSITCNFNTSNIYNNVGCYDGLGVNVEQDFRISEAIWNATASAWEVLIWQKNLKGNNSPVIMLECWTTNNTGYINAFNGIAAQTVELTQSTSYSAQRASSTGGTKTVEWATLPVYENPLGEEIATVSGLATVATSGSYKDLSNKPTILSEADVKGIKVDNATNADTAGKVAIPFTILSSPSGGSIYETFLAYDGSAHKSFMFGTDFWVDQTGTPTVFLNNSGVTAGTYNSVTVDKKGRVTAGTNTPAVDTSNLAKLDAENTFTKGQVITGSTSGGYSINASGYVKGSWLQAGVKSNYGSGTGMVCVFDGSGWIYYRTPSEILSEANGVPKSAFSLEGTTLTITI